MKALHGYQHINPSDFSSLIGNPSWYLDLQDYLTTYIYEYEQAPQQNTKTAKAVREELTWMISELMDEGKLVFASEGPNLDSERQAADTLVVHHTSCPSSYPTSYIDALVLLRLYVPEYLKIGSSKYGKPIWSGHFYNSRQTFVPYHYLVRASGEIEHILEDRYIGWQAGNWDINCRSIAIAFVDELEERRPSEKAIAAARTIIQRYNFKRIIGHNEVKKTRCPGDLFLGDNGWKQDLLPPSA